MILYRGDNLTEEMINDYQEHLNKYITWAPVTSIKENKDVVLLYGGTTLFEIHVPEEPGS